MRTRAVWVVAVCALLAACSSSQPPDSLPYPVSDWNGGAAATALLEGTLNLQGGCLTVDTAWSDNPTVIVLPKSRTQWDPVFSTLTMGGHTYQMGDTVSTGGGEVDYPNPHITLTVPRACEDMAQVSMFVVMDDTLS